ncbi:exportin-2-like protein [Trifolium pratense]|uniref:Exportin-2-like protein n=1 Tax=Trifolium pratense TaxID=57577 RepID=A0A2K3NR68_TRIPR|nr:exportin-2-like protein [Trifolium pratense]
MKKRFLLRTIFAENEMTEFENDIAAFNFQPFRWNGTLKLVNPSANASSTLSPALEPCRVAEFRLSEAAGLTNFGLVILRLVAEPDEQIESSIDEQIRLAAAVNFKNHLHLRWSSEDNPITESEKEQIKTLIVPLMLSATAKIQSQLRETVAIIADDNFAAPLLEFSLLIGAAAAAPEPTVATGPLFESQKLCFTLLSRGVELMVLRLWMNLGLQFIVLQSTSRDQLAITAIKFLTTVSTGPHHTLFAADGIIPQICQGIVIPVVMLREDDEEQFVMNHIEYIRRDMEGSDLDTRRRIACELLKGITKYYGDVVRHIVSTQIQSLLSSYAANPAVNWKHKDCAIYLLQSLDVNGYPMLKAGALKFFTMFRSQISKHVALQYLPDFVHFLTAESNLVHSYAASCIEKLLKDEGGRARYSSADIAPIFPMLMNNLFSALELSESEENQYVMKCIMTVLGVADIQRHDALVCIEGLGSLLYEVCKNPKNPFFNQYLFESVAILVKRASERDPSLVCLPLLVELNRPPIPPTYMQIFESMLSPDSWKTASNVPALVRLLQAFLEKAPNEISQGDRLNKVLGIFDTLIQSSSTSEQGFYVLNTVIESLQYEFIKPHISCIWNAIFREIQKRQTVKLLKSLLIFISLFLIKHGSSNVVDTINAVQPDLFSVILTQLWIPNLKLITGDIELKLTAVASTRLICESPVLLDSVSWENVGYTATFVRLQNAGKNKEDPLKEIRYPQEFFIASLSRLCAHSPGRTLCWNLIGHYYLDPQPVATFDWSVILSLPPMVLLAFLAPTL